VLVVKVTVFICFPGLLEVSNLTLRLLLSPGFMFSFWGYSGIVHPQDADALKIIKSELPVLVKLKSTSTTSPSTTSP